MRKVLLCCLFFLSFSLYAEDHPSFYGRHATGWHWYDDPIDEDINENEKVSSDPTEQMSVVRATIKRALDKAVISPTQDNVKDYISLQNQLMAQSGRFSETWKEILLGNPALDYSLVHPTNNMARQIESDQTNLKEEAAIRTLAKQSGLFFFYHSTCPYCQKFAPILKSFTERHHITVIPITTDGISLPEYPDSFIDKGQKETFHVTVEPALFAVNPYTKQAYPVSYGLMSETDLKKRILEIANRVREKNP
jgi:conjugal transfer pilus assembly protein TraF